ncbi:MAG: TaqI-like C-terminal specificity domain-containing protein [Treponema sp.]|nr:TaqI-like C-terminal specificity domain-containing protein [Treponema sp.]
MFQKSIIEKYLSKLDANLLHEKYEKYCANYKNETKIANIQAVKEEQYQEGFIRDVFCSVLNYTIKPEPDYNILTELKNETKNKNNARKSDGAICEKNNESRVRAVIELKGTDTTDLDTVARQAFDYKSHHENCNYAIVCNFERLRLYVETQIEFIEFNLFTLTFEDFCILYLLLELNQLKNDIPLKLKHETLSEEKQITANFYADYSTFKRSLFEDMIEKNPQTDKLLLFKKTQKILDRILFVLFCEDRGLLPANSVMGIIGDYQKLKEMGYGQPLYSVFKTYFDRIDKGYKSESDSTKNIFAYNGGLFKPDETLDNLTVGDDVLFIHSKRLADYDFESQISVDILGRIFENSLTEIEEVQKEIEAEKSGEKVEINNIGKRKKDGVFYTPEYITKYIVENTIGKLCERQRTKLNISDEEVAKAQTKKQKDTLNAALHEYQKWLFSLKILDPACGSGAFLTAALTQLKAEHRRVFDFLHAINNDSMMFEEYSDNSILENNLYGVDINEESVEITKLSLWLHTAQKDRKLTTLNNKIKCGNSLIDDPSVAGEKAFNWEKEFPEVFEKGGFDVVIGNPPYVPTEFISDCDKNFYEKTYKSAYGRINIYPIFYEKGIELLKENGLLGFITPYTILKNQYYIEARKFILNETKIKTLVDFANIQVFRDATVDSIVFIMEKGKSENNSFKYINKIEDFSGRKFNEIEINQNDILNVPDYSFSNLGNSFNFEKLYEDIIEVKNIVDFKQGIITGSNKKFLTKESSEKCKKVLSGSDFNRYKLSWSGDYVIYDEQELHRPRKPEIFEKDEKILLRQTGSFPICMIDTNSFYTLDTVHNGSLINANFNLKYIMCLLNSNLLRFIYESSINETGKVFAQVKIIYIDPLPIKNISLEAQQPFIALADKMLSLNETLQKKSTNFLKVVKQTFALEKISTKLETFYNLDFDGFLKELKQKVTPKTKLEWLEVFEETKKSLQEIQSQIATTDKEINALVYKLYDLTEEEIKIVEGR